VPIPQNLIANETIEFTSAKHWIAPVRDSAGAVLMLIGAYIVGWLSPNADGGIVGWIGNLLDLIRLGLVVGAIGWIVYNLIVWRTAEFAVTNLRVIREEGFISRRSSATMLSAISDVQSHIGMLGKPLGYGDLAIFTQSGRAGSDRFRTITRPEEFRNTIMTHKMNEVRAAASPSTEATAAPAMATAPTAPPSASADAADALVRLADLRDRGAITPEDYEAKKAEILARM
jgi:uncharacterized membrane protein YdbT with pleckstrin-like domain